MNHKYHTPRLAFFTFSFLFTSDPLLYDFSSSSYCPNGVNFDPRTLEGDCSCSIDPLFDPSSCVFPRSYDASKAACVCPSWTQGVFCILYTIHCVHCPIYIDCLCQWNGIKIKTNRYISNFNSNLIRPRNLSSTH